ncbi:MAG: SDR family oxidoreductase [Acidobacteria bacterium]|nr:SDR family oxidoreductase [Acidobacteriota bacterium]
MLQGKVALVTGGSRGIGLATAQALLAQGASVVTTGIDAARLAAIQQTLGPRAIAMQADVRDFTALERAVKTAVDRFGGLDILVNNAGIGFFAPVAEMSLEHWDDVIRTNVTGVFHGCRAALPFLKARGGGWIISISSLASTNAFPGGAAYCASKAAVNAFSEALMQEVRHDGIRVAYVMPGSVRTEFSGRAPGPGDEWKLAPDDVARTVVDLVGHPGRSLPSRVELRPSRPPRKG